MNCIYRHDHTHVVAVKESKEWLRLRPAVHIFVWATGSLADVSSHKYFEFETIDYPVSLVAVGPSSPCDDETSNSSSTDENAIVCDFFYCFALQERNFCPQLLGDLFKIYLNVCSPR